MAIKTWFVETRPQFLILSLVLTLLGGAAAAYHGPFSWRDTIIAGVGLLLLHISCNTLNDYFDYKSGLDMRVRRTPFSGGSGILPAGLMKPGEVLLLGLATFFLAVPVGVYFLWTKGPWLLPILLFGAFAVIFYSPIILRVGMGLGEITAGLGLGTLPVLGTIFVNHGPCDWRYVIVCAPSGFMVLNLLLLNEFPDIEADRTVKRKTLPVQFGWTAAAAIYTLFNLGTYAWIAGCVALGFMPRWTLLALLTLPLGLAGIAGAWGGRKDPARLIKGLGANVGMILLTQALMAAGFIVAELLER